MTEETARKKIVAICKFMVSEWDSGRDWRWPSAGHDTLAKLDEIQLDSKWPDYKSIASLWWFLHNASKNITEGMSGFENLSWEEALACIEESSRRLAKNLPIEDPAVLHYLPSSGARGCTPLASIIAIFSNI